MHSILTRQVAGIKKQTTRSRKVIFPALFKPAPVTSLFQKLRIGIVPTRTPVRVCAVRIGLVLVRRSRKR